MTPREKCAHLLRRFGLGASPAELDAAEKRGVHGTIDWLLNYEKTPETFEFSPWAFAFDEPEKVNMDVSRFPSWWALRMVTTNRPLEQNLTLFWHNHFAISGSKITFGPMMVDSVELLRQHATGNFRTLLGEIVRDPAMIRWLDTDTNIKGRPNENFARELMELFTLGIGNYTERDIQEATRVFTGWSLRNALPDSGRVSQYLQLKMSIEDDRPIIVFTDAPALRDRGPKTILGKTANFDADGVMDHLVKQPVHAKFMAKKLWQHYISPNPDAKQIEALAKAYVDAKYDIKATLYWMMTNKAFTTPESVRSIVKSPMHYTIAMLRQLDVPALLQQQGVSRLNPLAPVPAPVRTLAGTAAAIMRRQGMTLMYPPDVAGWTWGQAWVTTASMIERTKMGDYLFRNGPAMTNAMTKRLFDANVTDAAGVIDRLCEWFDVPASPEQRQALVELLGKNGGIDSLRKTATAQRTLASMFRVMTSIPDFQMT